MDKQVTILFPAPAPNTYISLIEKYIKESDFDVVYLDDVIKNKSILKKTVIANLNWFENIGDQNFFKYLYIVLRKIKYYIVLKQYHIKIIFTFHNMLPHDTKHKVIDMFLIKFCLINADKIVGLCDSSRVILKKYISEKIINEKLCIINHCSFTSIYKDLKKDEKIKSIIFDKEKKFHVLFFGLLRRYKNIELLLQLAEEFKNEKIDFIIAGNASEEKYITEIEAKCKKCGNIKLFPRYITDEEVITIYEWADISICPLNIKSSINSGSMILSFGFETPVIGPENGTIKDFPAKYNYSYKYKNERDHYIKLKEKFVEAYHDWLNDPLILKGKGKNLFNYLEKNFSYNITCKKYRNLYNDLIENNIKK